MGSKLTVAELDKVVATAYERLGMLRDVERKLRKSDDELGTESYVLGVADALSSVRKALSVAEEDHRVAEAWFEYGRRLVGRECRAYVDMLFADEGWPPAPASLVVLAPLVGDIDVCPLDDLSVIEADFIGAVLDYLGTPNEIAMVERAFGEMTSTIADKEDRAA